MACVSEGSNWMKFHKHLAVQLRCLWRCWCRKLEMTNTLDLLVCQCHCANEHYSYGGVSVISLEGFTISWIDRLLFNLNNKPVIQLLTLWLQFHLRIMIEEDVTNSCTGSSSTVVQGAVLLQCRACCAGFHGTYQKRYHPPQSIALQTLACLNQTKWLCGPLVSSQPQLLGVCISWFH